MSIAGFTSQGHTAPKCPKDPKGLQSVSEKGSPGAVLTAQVSLSEARGLWLSAERTSADSKACGNPTYPPLTYPRARLRLIPRGRK